MTGRLNRFRGIALSLVLLQNPVSDLRDPVFTEPLKAEIPDMRSVRDRKSTRLIQSRI